MKKQTKLGGRSWLLAGVCLLLLSSGLSYGQTLSDALVQDGVLGLSVGISGEVMMIDVQQGDLVKKGRLLLKLDDRVQASALKAAQARLQYLSLKLQLVEDDYERQQELYDEGSLSTVELQLLELGVLLEKSSVEDARAMVDVAKQNLMYTQIIAPADGEVIALPMIGQRVNTEVGLPILLKLRLN